MSVQNSIALYVHIPWCIKKCPYCDFNSHQQKDVLPESEYISHLLADLDQDLRLLDNAPRTLSSIFIGGGTPSLFSPKGIASLLEGIHKRIAWQGNIEITMEANPGTFEASRFAGFYQAGINRLSIGVQSYQHEHLLKLGRVHDAEQAILAVQHASTLGFRSFNTDLMHGLQGQSTEQAIQDLQISIELGVPHISWYQLTIEPNTQFYSKPPVLPDDEQLWDIQAQGHSKLLDAGYIQYEISAYAKPQHQSHHNLNYWRFGDYLGIGCGAHGKLTDFRQNTLTRTTKIKHPKGYMDLQRSYLDSQQVVEQAELPFEYFMNRFRLLEPCPKNEYEQVTSQHLDAKTLDILHHSVKQGLLIEDATHWQVSELGRRYLNDLLAQFI